MAESRRHIVTEKVPNREEILDFSASINSITAKLEEALRVRYAHIKEKIESAPTSKFLGIRCLELHQAFAHLKINVSKNFANWNGTTHGGIICSLIDTAIGAAVETLICFEEEPIATISLNVDFLSPVEIGNTLSAKASCGDVSVLEKSNITMLQVPENGKKLVQATATVVTKLEEEERVVAKATAWFTVFGKR